jgi:hypothetical protein
MRGRTIARCGKISVKPRERIEKQLVLPLFKPIRSFGSFKFGGRNDDRQ